MTLKWAPGDGNRWGPLAFSAGIPCRSRFLRELPQVGSGRRLVGRGRPGAPLHRLLGSAVGCLGSCTGATAVVRQKHPGGELDAFAGGVVGDAMRGGDLLSGVVEEFPHEVELCGGDVRCGCKKGALPGVCGEPLFEVADSRPSEARDSTASHRETSSPPEDNHAPRASYNRLAAP